MIDIKNADVSEKFGIYPNHVKKQLLILRRLILETASEMDNVSEVEETLKWGEPSYLTKTGSTIRIDWKESNPEQFALHFHCKTTLVDTFKEIFGNQLVFEGNRAIVFNVNEEIPIKEIKQCVSLALSYHRVKHLPLLGA